MKYSIKIFILFFIIHCSLFIIHCSLLYSQPNTALYNLLLKLPKDTILNIKTYDGSGQVAHPDIIYLNQNNKSAAFYLTLTPYPHYNDSLENPCIYKSSDGLNFIEPPGSHNPVVNAPVTYKKNNHHNDDPDISYEKSTVDSRQSTVLFRIVYIQTMSPDSQLVNCLESNDLVNWKNLKLIKYDFNKKENFILSPSLIVKNHKYFLFYVNKRKVQKNTIEYLKSRNFYKWNKLRANQIKIKLPDDVTPWHIDIVGNNKKYYMLLNAYVGAEPVWNDKAENKYVLYFAESSNLKEWTPLVKLMDCCDIPDTDCRYVYRSTGLVENDLLVVWYSYTNWKQEWFLGLKKFNINSLTHP